LDGVLDLLVCGWAFHPAGESTRVDVVINEQSFPAECHVGMRCDVFEHFKRMDFVGGALRSGFRCPIVVPVHRLAVGPGKLDISVSVSVTLVDGSRRTAQLAIGSVSVVTQAPKRHRRRASSDQVAIAMATFNPDPELFDRQLSSIRAQSHKNWRLLISDESVDDRRRHMLERLVADDSRIVLAKHTERVGFFKNFERALSMAKDAEFVALSDQDDVWHAQKIEVLLERVRSGATLAFADMRLVDPKGAVLAETFWFERDVHHDDPLDLAIANTVTGASSLFRARLLEVALPFPNLSDVFHDQWLAMSAATSGTIEFVPLPLHDYVQHDRNVIGAEGSGRVGSAPWLSALYDLAVRQRRSEVGERILEYAAACWGMEPVRIRQIFRILQSRLATNGHGLKEGDILARARHLAEERDPRRRDAAFKRTLGAEWRLAATELAEQRLHAESARVCKAAWLGAQSEDRRRATRTDERTHAAIFGDASDGGSDLVAKIRPLRVALGSTEPPRVNVVIPEIRYEHFFGGYIGKFSIIKKMLELGLRVRVICIDQDGVSAEELLSIERAFPDLAGVMSRLEIHWAGDRSRVIRFSSRDHLVATTWWTAHVVHSAAEQLGLGNFLYLIQEYEPFTFPMGTWHSMARASYDLPHDALFSTALLAEYFEKNKIGVYAPSGSRRAAIFSNAIQYFEKSRTSGVPRRRRLVFYYRPEPHAARNMCEMGLAALRACVESGALDAAKWEFWGVGTKKGSVRLGGGAELQQLGKLTVEEYRRRLTECDVGVALMYTPHPSLVPLEMAAAGLVTVTTECENKTRDKLLALSPNFEPCAPTVAGVEAGIRAAVQRAGTARLNAVNWPQSWSDSLNGAVDAFLRQTFERSIEPRWRNAARDDNGASADAEGRQIQLAGSVSE
jgi:hypothetical protein